MAEKEVKKTEPVKKEQTKKQEPKAPAKKEETYIMKVTHLAWGKDGKNHFYADKKPLITKKKLGHYASVLKIWEDNGWIEKGAY